MDGLRKVNVKFSGVNPAVSCCRLRQVQALLSKGATATPDGILCPLGIDSRYNEGCTEMAKYLFYGLYGKSHVNLGPDDDFSEELLDDVMLLIKAECVHLYCNPMNYNYLLPYVSHWRNLHLYCMTQTEYEDEQAAEEFKIFSFVTMVQDCQRIGVPYSAQGHIQKFDMFMVEKWPLIQAFALEGIGRGSFFTMKYKLMDMSEDLWRVYNRLDPVSLDNLLSEDVTLFEKQWSSFFSSMDLESHLSILELSEAQAGEAFHTYYSHGLITRNFTDQSKSRQPFLLFGNHSSSEDLENYSFNFPSESHQVRNTGPQGSAAKHMILQCVSPKGPLACSRTYFYGSTHSPFIGQPKTEQEKTEVIVLSEIYSAAVQGVLSGIECFSFTSSIMKAKDVAEKSFLAALNAVKLSHYRNVLRSKCKFSIQAVNKQGRTIPLTDTNSRYVVKTASMIINNIPDLKQNKGTYGSVVFSESFLESRINIQDRDGSVSSDCCSTILTATVPRYACWPMERDVKLSEEAQRLAQKDEAGFLGAVLTVADSAFVFSCSQLASPDEGKIVFFSEGILFIHSQCGCITMCNDHISRIGFYDPDSSSVASLFVHYELTLHPHLPFSLQSADRCLVFAFQPGSKSLKAFYSKVLSVWRSPESKVGLLLLDDLSPNQRKMHTALQKLHDSHQPPVAKRKGSLKNSPSKLPDQEMFLQHFALSSISREPILSEDLETLFSSTEFRSVAAGWKDKVVITIITGLPGSHKEKLASTLVKQNKDCGRWVVYESDSFSASHLQRFLSNFLESQRRGRGKPRLLLLSPGYTDVLDVVQAVLFHPDPVVQACFSIGAVTACVNPLSSCMEHRFSFPKLLEQCSQGVVSAVVFTALTAEEKNPLMQHVQQLVRSANPTAAFILAESGAVIRKEDMSVILSESSFSETQMLRARYVLYPGWCRGRFSCGSASLVFTQHRVAFSRPLERPLFIACCNAISSSLKPSPFRGNVYNIRGKIRFSDSEQLTEVSYNAASGALSIVPDDSDASCFLLFDGVGLSEDGLKDWLRLCAKQKQPRKTKKTKNTLSPQEIKDIHISRHLDPLPPGFFYNGYQFMDIFGEKRNFHPSMDEFIKEYIAEANKDIEHFNRQLELQEEPDLFDP